MRISELAATTGVPVATLKYYLREGVLHTGRPVSRTQAEYDDSHVERVRLVRSLAGVGGLSIATIQRVLEVISEPGLGPADIMGAAQRAFLGADVTPDEGDVLRCDEGDALRCDEGASKGASKGGQLAGSPARDLFARMGWQVRPGNPAIDDLDRAWEACLESGLGLDEGRMERYAAAMLDVAAVDISSAPAEPAAAVRHVVLGTPLVDAVLVPLRRIAQQHTALSAHAKATHE